jgi:hypothetical protein
MPVTFPRARTVEPGAPVTSTEAIALAEACNARIRSGLGDPTFRIVFYLMGLFRQMRNSDGGFLFPSQAEFFEVYQALTAGEGEWPVNFAGGPEGANVANPMCAFVFGRESARIFAEVDRIEVVPFDLPANPTARDFWDLAKRQRGAIDPKSGAVGSPIFTAAREHLRIAYSVRAPYANSYGGFLPIPEIGGTACAPDGDITPVNYLYKFTNLETGQVIQFDGSCPEEPTHVGFILRLGDVYVIVLNNGAATYLNANEWIEGPYTGGGSLRRDTGGQLARAVDRFAKDFRGADGQREAGKWNEFAFDFQKFLTRQYLLSPNVGVRVGDNITVTYPQFRIKGPAAPGALSNPHTYQRGYVLTGAHFSGASTQSVVVEWLDGKEVIHESTLEQVGGKIDQVVMLPKDVAPATLRFRLKSAFDGGLLEIEATELYPYKPQAHDLYAFLRIASARSGVVHGSGKEEFGAVEIGDSYFRSGAVVPGPGLPLEESVINTNAVFDAARRMSQCVRILTRDQLAGYAVQDGKSILWVRVKNRIGKNSLVGIVPDDNPVPEDGIKEHVRYSCKVGSVWYNGTEYSAGQPFVGVRGVSGYFGATVYVHDGIRHKAPPSEFSNEWVIDFQFKAYNPSESSIWKPSAYSDYFLFSDRCHFYHNPYPSNLQQQFDYGKTLSLAPEAANGYRYVQGTNVILCDPMDTACEDARLARYKSCRLYEPPVEVDKAEWDNGLLKLTLTGRLHHADTAPASISRDIGTWDSATIEAEGYRTNENAIRQYLLWATNGRNTPLTLGDYAVNSGVPFLTDQPYGSVFPHIMLVQLIPKQYEDGNDTQQRHDTPLLSDTLTQVELYLRAMCEGYVDGTTSEKYACASGIASTYDYSFPNLMFDASNGKWISSLAWHATQRLKDRDIRKDRPEGFGVYPNTLLSSQVFNQFANAVNKLDRVRVMLPFKLQRQTMQDTFINPNGVMAKEADGDNATCTGGSINFYYVGGAPDGVPTTVTVPWFDDIGAVGRVATAFQSNPDYFTYCVGDKYGIATIRERDEYRYELTDPDAEYAIPESWRGQVSTNGQQLFQVFTITRSRSIRQVPLGGGTVCNSAEPWVVVPGVTVLDFVDDEIQDETCEVLPATGFVNAPPLGTVVIAGGNVLGTQCDTLPVSSQEHSRTIVRVPTDGIVLRIPLE